jgi:hypothetical protein
MLKSSNLPDSYWATEILTAVYIKNRSLTKAYNEKKTPFELFYGKVPDVSHLRVFGCKAFVYNTDPGIGKLDNRGIEGIFVGYGRQTTKYIIYIPSTRTFVNSASVKFFEPKLVKPHLKIITSPQSNTRNSANSKESNTSNSTISNKSKVNTSNNFKTSENTQNKISATPIKVVDNISQQHISTPIQLEKEQQLLSPNILSRESTTSSSDFTSRESTHEFHTTNSDLPLDSDSEPSDLQSNIEPHTENSTTHTSDTSENLTTGPRRSARLSKKPIPHWNAGEQLKSKQIASTAILDIEQQ